MSLGSLALRFRQKFGHGLRVAYWRDVVRPRILQTRAISDTSDPACEIHVMTSKSDWLNLMWALKSFYWASKKAYSLCIHDDGSLDAESLAVLERHFPAARIVRRAEADERIRKALAGFPRSLDFRLTNLLAPKVFDFALYLNSKRMLLLDSDILFFNTPRELLDAADCGDDVNTFNPDFDSAYTVTSEAVRSSTSVQLQPRINSGLGIVHAQSLSFEWIEEFLQIPGILSGHFWRIEQTIYALCSSRFGVKLLSDEYQVRLTPGIGCSPCRHYVGAIRHWMYSEGMRTLVKKGMLEELGAC
jgi:hypothetical protein